MGAARSEQEERKPTSLSYEQAMEAQQNNLRKVHWTAFDELMEITEVDEAEPAEVGDGGSYSNGNSAETAANANN